MQPYIFLLKRFSIAEPGPPSDLIELDLELSTQNVLFNLPDYVLSSVAAFAQRH